MAIDIDELMRLVFAANPHYERTESWKQKSALWRLVGPDKRSSLRPLFRAIADYNDREAEETRRAVAYELLTLPDDKRTGRYAPVVAYLEGLEELKGALRLEQGRLRLLYNNYRVNAGRNDYESYFGDTFSTLLSGMTEEDIWMDAGAGEAVAMRQYIDGRKGRGHARCVALGYAKPDSLELGDFERRSRGFRYVSGKYFDQMSTKDLGFEPGSVSLITDYNGVLLYTTTLSQDLSRMLELLRRGGVLLCGFHADIYRDDKAVDVADWLDQASGARFRAVIYNSDRHFELTRGSGEVLVPPLEYVAENSKPNSAPPVRWFLWKTS